MFSKSPSINGNFDKTQVRREYQFSGYLKDFSVLQITVDIRFKSLFADALVLSFNKLGF
jgi:hypothetical protein